ncbi:MAG: hypothetical protein J6S94_00150 [Bacteroidaceae bacterium]|nr:hypothetical protein [Bacteroidaceae bacterium]
MKKLLVIGIAMMAMCFVACTEDRESQQIVEAVKTLVSQYPKATLQDVYKSFYQERFGPGHMIPNVENARNYLMSEMEQASENSGAYYEPTGSEGKYIRVYLNAVADGKISAEQLLDAFVESANNVEPRSDKWADQWANIVKVIEEKQLPVAANDELKQLLKTCSEQDEAVHHSEAYNQAYRPHYRIVERDIFEQQLKRYLVK